MTSADEDPDTWITSLELKRRRLKTLGTTIEDDDMILHILNNLPREYETVVELCEEDLSRGTVNLQTVKERIRARFTRLQKANENMDEAIALMAKQQFKGACSVCGKIGHKGADCFTLERNKDKKEAYFKKMDERRNKNNKNNQSGNQKNSFKNKKHHQGKKHGNNQESNQNANTTMAMTNIDEEMILIAESNPQSFNSFTWIADSGASTHMTNTMDGMFDVTDANINISVGDGRKMTTTKVGKWKGVAIDLEGRKTNITLTNVSFVPDLMVNLFSLTAAMDKGFSVTGSKDGIDLKKGNWSMSFNRRVGTPRGHVFASSLIPADNYNVEYANISINYEKAHQLLGHPGRNLLLGTADRLAWKIKDKATTECEDCLKGKARRMNMNKESSNRSLPFRPPPSSNWAMPAASTSN